jgi:transcriptional regulator with XRE-family HTH domain
MTVRIGSNIKKIRELKNLSQEFMASRLNLSQGAYSNIENDKTELNQDRIKEIATILEVDPFLLYSFDEKVLFNNCTQSAYYIHSIQNTGEHERQAYTDMIEELKKQLEYLRSQNESLMQLLKAKS